MLKRIVTVTALALGGAMLSKQERDAGADDDQFAASESIDVSVPVRAAYDQWIEFEDYPRFMEQVREVRRLDGNRLRWRAGAPGNETEWETEITEQLADRKIAWCSTFGPFSGGSVSFEPLSRSRTRILLELYRETHDAGQAPGGLRPQARSALTQFKQMIESRGRLGARSAWPAQRQGTVAESH